jgi:uncharacterized protein (DUF1800 family)
MGRGQPQTAHLLRRGGFGASAGELKALDRYSPQAVTEYLLNFDRQPDDVDSNIQQSAYVSVTTRGGQFQPNVNIDDARQRWLFRMVHSARPLQEKMALFWHNHFATAYTKLAGIVPAAQATKMLALVEGELPGPRGQLELFRQMGLGSFRDLLVEVARDPAMLVWLDGRVNFRARPQENFGREVMELFTFGLGNYVEQDVYAAARVFTGWNLGLTGGDPQQPTAYYNFVYNPTQHETSAKTFSFPIYADGGKTIAARSAADGMQDGLDFLTALARHPETARRLVRKLWNFFVSEVNAPDDEFIETAARIYLQYDTQIKPVVAYILQSSVFLDPANWYTRYSWPAEFVVRAIKEVGWNGFSVDVARAAMINMGQTLFEPPDVAGWSLGQEWFSSGTMLARMNFAATLAANQRVNLGRDAAVASSAPDDFVSYFIDRLTASEWDAAPYGSLQAYVASGGAWTGSTAQLQSKAAGLTRLIIGSSEYQFI